jgi:methyl-accepting chemotaxis protein
MKEARRSDPSILELVGELADLLGLAERIQRFLPTQRLKVQRKHRRVEKLLDAFNEARSDARTALRIVSTTVDQHLADHTVAGELDRSIDAPNEVLPRIAFSMPTEEIPVYRRGVEQLQTAIQKMTKIAFDLEATSAGVTDEVQRYYKISQAGNAVLRSIRHALEDHPESVPDLVHKVEEYLARCSQMLEQRQRWLEE